MYKSQLQVLINEAENSQKMDKSGKAKDTNASSPVKELKVESSSESYVEMDSRLLSALLTVSINLLFF